MYADYVFLCQCPHKKLIFYVIKSCIYKQSRNGTISAVIFLYYFKCSMFSFILNMLTQRRGKCTFRKLIDIKFVLA